MEVVAAVIERPDGAILFAQRPSGKVYAGWWEFPGGKIERDETAAQALRRDFVACPPGTAFNEVLFRTFRIELWFAALLSAGALLGRIAG